MVFVLLFSPKKEIVSYSLIGNRILNREKTWSLFREGEIFNDNDLLIKKKKLETHQEKFPAKFFPSIISCLTLL